TRHSVHTRNYPPMSNGADPHASQPVLAAGEPLESARAVMIMIHGRGATAEIILGLAGALDVPGFAYLAPQAGQHTWYPYSFLQRVERNEPHLSSALGLVGTLIEQVAAQGMARERIVLLGFSQGACLSVEFVARHPARYGEVVGLS